MSEALTIVKGQAHEDTMIIGQALGSFSMSINNEQIEPIFEDIKAKYGFKEIDPEEWYPLQLALDTYKAVREKSRDALILVSIGTKVIEAAQLPDEIETIEDSIRLLMDIHHLNLKNVPEGDGYANLDVGDKKITFDDHTVFPHDIIYGYIFGLVQRFRPENARPTVQRKYHNEAKPDHGGATYTVQWK